MTIKVKIPEGIDNGQTISLRGEGPGLRRPPGNLYIEVRLDHIHYLYEKAMI